MNHEINSLKETYRKYKEQSIQPAQTESVRTTEPIVKKQYEDIEDFNRIFKEYIK